MTVDPRISLAIVKKELEDCEKAASLYHWVISPIDEANQLFTVKMRSPSDDQEYVIEIKFDNYNEIPPFIEFIDPTTGQRGTKNAYPRGKGRTGSFFHPNAVICHPCSRKAYGNLHRDWTLAGWQSNPKTGTLTTMRAILEAIYSRISNDEEYGGRMHG
jgi:hypothetical protein